MCFIEAAIFKKYVTIHLLIHQTFIEHLLSTGHTCCVLRWSNPWDVQIYQICVRLFVLVIEVIMMEMGVLSHIKIAWRQENGELWFRLWLVDFCLDAFISAFFGCVYMFTI